MRKWEMAPPQSSSWGEQAGCSKQPSITFFTLHGAGGHLHADFMYLLVVRGLLHVAEPVLEKDLPPSVILLCTALPSKRDSCSMWLSRGGAPPCGRAVPRKEPTPYSHRERVCKGERDVLPCLGVVRNAAKVDGPFFPCRTLSASVLVRHA
eukprot:1158344-Pelagomonas_calceolata.AAC.15